MKAKITLTYRNEFGVLSECSYEQNEEMTEHDVIDWFHHTGLRGVGFSAECKGMGE